MPLRKNTDEPASEPAAARQPTEEAPTDNVAMVSRNSDLSDAQPNATVRILDDDAAAEADKAQALESE